MISAIVLAAGQSRRMGKTKQLLDWGGKTILQRVLQNLSRSRVDEIILVLGHEADKILPTVEECGVRVVLNKNYREGMITSIREGLSHLHPEAEAFLIVLADQPGVGPEIVDRLIEAFRGGDRNAIVVPTFGGRRGHPALFPISYKEEALRIRGDVGLRAILEAHPEKIFQVEMETDSILQDIDTPEAYSAQNRNRQETP